MASSTMQGCHVHCWSLFSRMSSSSPEPLFSAAMQLSACQIPSLEVASMPLASSHLLHTLLVLALASPSHLVLSHLIPPGLMLAHGRGIFGHEEKGHSRDLPVQLRQAEDLRSTYGLWSLVPQQRTDSEESWRGSWQRDSLLCLLQPPISSLLSCPFLPASPHSHSRFWSCVPPLISPVPPLVLGHSPSPTLRLFLFNLLFPLGALPHQITLPGQPQLSPIFPVALLTRLKFLFPLSCRLTPL